MDLVDLNLFKMCRICCIRVEILMDLVDLNKRARSCIIKNTKVEILMDLVDLNIFLIAKFYT